MSQVKDPTFRPIASVPGPTTEPSARPEAPVTARGVTAPNAAATVASRPAGADHVAGVGTDPILSSSPTTGNAALDTETAAGASSFSTQLSSMGPRLESSDDIMSSFLKLQIDAMSQGQDFEALLHEARGILRRMAFKEEAMLAARMPFVQQLRAEAAALEEQAEALAEEAFLTWQNGGPLTPEQREAMGSMGGLGGGLDLESMLQQANLPVDVKGLEREAWKNSMLNSFENIQEAAELRQQSEALRKAGKKDEAWKVLEKASTLEFEIQDNFDAMGMPLSFDNLTELERLSLESKAAGKDGYHTMTCFLANHPELCEQLLPGVDPATIAERGFKESDLDAIVDRQLAAQDPEDRMANLVMALGNASEEELMGLMSSFGSQNPEGMAAAMPMFVQAAEMYQEAQEKRAQALLIQMKYEDAKLAVRNARSEEQTHGVLRRSADRQKDIMDGLTLIMGGGRGDQDAMHEAMAEAERWRNDVARAVGHMVETQQEMTTERLRRMRT